MEPTIRYHEGLDFRSVAPTDEVIKRLTQLGGPFPQETTDPLSVLALLDDIGSPTTVATTGGRFFGFVVRGALPAALGANWLAGMWDQNAFGLAGSPVAVVLEEIALAWLLEILALPAGFGGLSSRITGLIQSSHMPSGAFTYPTVVHPKDHFRARYHSFRRGARGARHAIAAGGNVNATHTLGRERRCSDVGFSCSWACCLRLKRSNLTHALTGTRDSTQL